jgi:hypothetical protein
VRKFFVRTEACRSWRVSRLPRISQNKTNNFGVGGRLGYRIHHNVMIEAELAYDYGINFDEVYRNIANGDVTAIGRTSIGVTHGLFGPAVQPAKGAFRPLATLKGGFVDFRLSPSLLPFANVYEHRFRHS